MWHNFTSAGLFIDAEENGKTVVTNTVRVALLLVFY